MSVSMENMSAEKKCSDKKYSKDEMNMVDQYMRKSKPLFALSIAFLSIFAYLVLNRKIELGKYSKTSSFELIDFTNRLKYVLIHLTPGITWILLSVWFVINRRIGSPAVNPMNGYEGVTQESRNNLTNSIEHFLMSAVSQLILIVHLDASTTLNIIPALNLLFLIGRVTFWLGYPRYRSFGFFVTHLPILSTIAFNVYKFTSYLKIN